MDIGTPQTAHVYAYRSLRAQILSGELSPGSPLVQTALAAQLNVSMTPVREALRDLSTEGLVIQEPHKGAFVASLDGRDAIEIVELRLRLEPPLAAEASLLMSEEKLQEAEALAERLNQLSGAEWVAANREFHYLLLSDAPSQRAKGILKNLLESAALYVGLALQHRQGPAPDVEHANIIDAYRSRDANRVEEAVRTHLQSSLRSLQELAVRGVARGDTE